MQRGKRNRVGPRVAGQPGERDGRVEKGFECEPKGCLVTPTLEPYLSTADRSQQGAVRLARPDPIPLDSLFQMFSGHKLCCLWVSPELVVPAEALGSEGLK